MATLERATASRFAACEVANPIGVRNASEPGHIVVGFLGGGIAHHRTESIHAEAGRIKHVDQWRDHSIRHQQGLPCRQEWKEGLSEHGMEPKTAFYQ